MSELIILGTDTDAGKTTFSLLWLTAFIGDYAYWKPVETGVSDSETVSRLVPGAAVFPRLCHFEEAIAPPLAAKRTGSSIPSAAAIAASRPHADRLLIETFGGPLSPLNETELQVELVRRLGGQAILVGSSRVGAVGRCLSTQRVLELEGIRVRAIVLIGTKDEYAENEIARHGSVPVVGLEPPASWDEAGIVSAVQCQSEPLQTLRCHIEEQLAPKATRRLTDLMARDRQSVWHPYTALRGAADPLPVVGAQDEFIELADGRRLIDGISSWWTILHGHRPPRLMAALRQAAERIDHVLFAGVTHPYAIESAELLVKTTPWPNGRVFFSDNGSTAVEVALKMAYQFWCHRGETQRKLFIGLEGAYHGDTFGAMAISRDPLFFGRFEPLLFETERVPPSPNRLDELLKMRAIETAAVIVEPLVQGAGGMIMHSPETLRDLCDVARRHGVLFIVDEVMTGARTGTFWAHSQAAIEPDLICAAKTLAGGILPLAATLASPRIVEAFDVEDRGRTFFHGHSFTANPLACAVAAENLRLMATGAWQAESERINRFWQDAAIRLARVSNVANIRACGTILALDVGSPDGYLAKAGAAMRSAAITEGVLLRPLGHVLYAMPPLCTSDESLERIVNAMIAATSAAS
jgi:adenosylmethionine-8-amino-7-oxononanoate aminotransferase